MFQGMFCGDEEHIHVKVGICGNIHVVENEMDYNLVDTIFSRVSQIQINSRITKPPQTYADLF